ncbi:MAG: haloacid dehalogenase [Candidatus Dojkabacteria bacterium]|nr:MAG: haloacid dehalogenase [Candidatus Dojkabacteria bacterium]
MLKSTMFTYDQAHKLLEQYIQNQNLRKHCYAVESCMRFYARKLNQQNEIDWAVAGLLHDIDWELYPDTHPITAVPILQEAGVSQEIIDAILGHAYPSRTDVQRQSLMAKYLFACDELSGFIVAYALMKPGRLKDIDGYGVAKKLKEKAFARNVSREDIETGLTEIGLDIVTHANNLIEAMQADTRLGLD